MMTALAAHASHDLVPPWIALAVYAPGVIVTARIVFATDDSESRFTAFAVGLFWPLVLAVFVIGRLLTLLTLGAKSGHERQMKARKAERERSGMASRIVELEREAGIE